MTNASSGPANKDDINRLGATYTPRGVHFRVWAPQAHHVEVVFQSGRVHPLTPQTDGYFIVVLPGIEPGTRYKYRIDDRDPVPDPGSSFQPEGPHGWSEFIDHYSYRWNPTETIRAGPHLKEQVIYEIHVGAFTQEGTFRAAEAEFPRLCALGITLLEIMPIAEFPGRFGWGYDGVSLFAPFHHYGTPDDLRHMIEAAHSCGLNVVLDVVYNHLGPDGNYLPNFSPYYFAGKTEWGDAPNFDGEHSLPVRDFFIQNAEQWIRDYHFDGLRLDATQSICDCGTHGEHILAAIARSTRAVAGDRSIMLFCECERQFNGQILPPPEGCGLDAMWNDDFHHSAFVRLTGRREAYHTDHLGHPQEFISAAKYGFLYQGQYYSWQNAPRGTSFLHTDPCRAISFLENHDQVANTLVGTHPRAISSPRKYRAMVAYWLLSSGTPMFFMGQEYGSSRPFLYFADHQSADLCETAHRGRVEFLLQFESIRNMSNVDSLIPKPCEEETFLQCKLDPAERDHPESVQLQRLFFDLLRLRREDPAISSQHRGTVDGAVLTDDCFVLRFFLRDLGGEDLDRLLLVNFGPRLELRHLPEPLLAPPSGVWQSIWNSEQPDYGGTCAIHPVTEDGWHISEECAILLAPR